MPWKTGGLRPHNSLEVTYKGDFYKGWVSEIFQAAIRNAERKEIKLEQGWENGLWEELAKNYPSYIIFEAPVGPAPLQVSVSTIKSFLNFARKRIGDNSLVDEELARKRAAVCSVCPKAAPITGCSMCKSMARQMMKTPNVNFLPKNKNGCSVCGCFIDVKIYLPFEILNDTVTQYPWHEDCWMLSESLGIEE